MDFADRRNIHSVPQFCHIVVAGEMHIIIHRNHARMHALFKTTRSMYSIEIPLVALIYI